MRRSPRYLPALPCVVLLALTAACGATGPTSAHGGHTGAQHHAGSSTTTSPPGSSTTTPPGSSTTTSAPPTSGGATLRSATWTSVSLPGDVCPGRTQPITLSHGKATIPAPSGVTAPTGLNVTAGRHVVGDLYGPGHDVAALDVRCSAAHGSTASERENSWVLYTDNGTLQPIATLQPQQPTNAHKGVHVPYFVTAHGGIVIAPGTVTVKELWYTASDKTCCPSQHVTTVWHAHGTSFSAYTSVGG
ncbi:MAG TPA: hypothetical protein VND62_04565 [Acidimicrobiales bacterium]|nr:hypothetical protein [Acidimicrobiales bacterium]